MGEVYHQEGGPIGFDVRFQTYFRELSICTSLFIGLFYATACPTGESMTRGVSLTSLIQVR